MAATALTPTQRRAFERKVLRSQRAFRRGVEERREARLREMGKQGQLLEPTFGYANVLPFRRRSER